MQSENSFNYVANSHVKKIKNKKLIPEKIIHFVCTQNFPEN